MLHLFEMKHREGMTTIITTAHAVQNPGLRSKRKPAKLVAQLAKAALLKLPKPKRWFPTCLLLTLGLASPSFAGYGTHQTGAYYTFEELTATTYTDYHYVSNKDILSVEQKGNQLTITYKTYNYNGSFTYNPGGTDGGTDRIAAHSWGVFDTTAYNVIAQAILSRDDLWDRAHEADLITEDKSPLYQTNSNPTKEEINAIVQQLSHWIKNITANDDYIANKLKQTNTSFWYTKKPDKRIKLTTLDALLQKAANDIDGDQHSHISIATDYSYEYYYPWADDEYPGNEDIWGLAILIDAQAKCLWADNNGNFSDTGGGSAGDIFTQTITLQPELIGHTLKLITWQKGYHTGSKDHDQWRYFDGGTFTVQNFHLPTPASSNVTLETAQPWHPDITSTKNPTQNEDTWLVSIYVNVYDQAGYPMNAQTFTASTYPLPDTQKNRTIAHQNAWDQYQQWRSNPQNVPTQFGFYDTYSISSQIQKNNTTSVIPHEKQYKIQGYTDWLLETQTWEPSTAGDYTFQVRLHSLAPNWADSNPSGNYTLTVKKIPNPQVPLNIQTPTEVTIALGDTYVPDLSHPNNNDKDKGTYEFKVQGKDLDELKYTPPTPGTYTLKLQHMGETIDNTEYLTSDLVTITLHVLEDHAPTVEGKRSTNTANGAIPDGHYTYAGDTLSLEITTTDPDHDHDPKLQQQLGLFYFKLVGPKGNILENPDIYPNEPDANGHSTHVITTKLSDGPGTYLMLAKATDYSGLSSPETEIYRITVTEPYAFYRISASAKPAAGLEAWFTPSGTTQQIVKLPRPRGPIQPNP
jgi:hypothetical protein